MPSKTKQQHQSIQQHTAANMNITKIFTLKSFLEKHPSIKHYTPSSPDFDAIATAYIVLPHKPPPSSASSPPPMSPR